MRNITKNLLLVIVAMYWFSQYVYVPFQTPYLLSIGATTAFIGAVTGGYGLSQLLLRIPVGIMADRRAPHAVMVTAGTVLVGIASMLRIIAPTPAGFLIANLLSGFASAMWISFMVFFSDMYEDNHRQKSVGIIVAVNNFGILAAFLTGSILYDKVGIVILCVLSLIVAAAAAILSFFLPRPLKRNTYPEIKDLVKVFVHKRLIGFALIAFVLQGIIMTTCMSFTNQILKELGAGGFEVGLSSMMYIIAAVVTSFFASTEFAVRKGAAFWLICGLFFLSASCFITADATKFISVYIAQFFAGIAVGLVFTFTSSEGMKTIPKDRRTTAMGFFQAVYAIGMTLLPVASGNLALHISMRNVYYLLGMIPAGCSVILIMNFRKV